MLKTLERMLKTPEEVLQECGIQKPPVAVDTIAAFYGIEVCSLPASNDIFGAIMRTSSNVLIAVNPKQHPNRQRFTLAHELGHFFCHPNEAEHVDRDFRISWRKTNSSAGVDWHEVEANRFAAALLMPEEFLRRDLNRVQDFDDATIKHLASRYKVSALAMRFRLLNLGLISPESFDAE